jgi:hypothetical protein
VLQHGGSRADAARNHHRRRQGAESQPAIYIGGKPNNRDQLVIFSKEDPASRQFRNLVRYVEPPRDAGKMVLLDGRNLWFYDPSSKASVRISPQQRLIGQAAIGDVPTSNFVSDYAGTLLGDETIADTEHQQPHAGIWT